MTRRGEDIPSRHRIEALALLAVAIRDERAPLTIRITAARELLQRSEATRSVTVSDLASMTPQARQDLWMALITCFEEEMPGSLRQMMQEAVEEALQHQATQPRRIGFVRGDRTANGGPRWPAASAQAARRRSVPSAQEKPAPAASGASDTFASERALEADAGELPDHAELPQRTVPIGFLTPEEVKANRRAFDRSLLEPYPWRS